jgi:hypothetical protein
MAVDTIICVTMYAHVALQRLALNQDWIKTLYVEGPAVAIVGIVGRGIVRWDYPKGYIQQM